MSAFYSDIKDAPLLALKYSESSIYSSSENLLLMVVENIYNYFFKYLC